MDSSLSRSNMDSAARLMKSVLCKIRYKYAFIRWSEPDLSFGNDLHIGANGAASINILEPGFEIETVPEFCWI